MANQIESLEREAIVTLTIAPGRAGQVQFQGSWWKARCADAITLLPGTIVYVIDRQFVTTLYVKPVVASV
ncbi:NfeD family protein [Microcoleus sp. FACHB-1515]|uniref:NfeD family protein n=1 Tax=Cyanophyceae TaxID=3028117 RepID=UPI001687F970|nr:NfeD family protein [Microcoleus sp. FACHB-1515]MBD2092003.1 NfeD family protein [Microcoleus sp. FACHB-1515]